MEYPFYSLRIVLFQVSIIKSSTDSHCYISGYILYRHLLPLMVHTCFFNGLISCRYRKEKISLKWIIFICFILFTLGSIETYSGFLENTQLLSYYYRYASVFLTSRNGLFFTPIFICIGYLLFENKESNLFTRHTFIKLIISFAFVCIEGFIIFPNQGLDKNFLFTLIPFSMFLFNWAIRTDIFRNQNFGYFKKLSMYYFFLHPIFIELLSIPSIEEKFNPIYFGWIKFIFALIGTHCLSLLFIRLSQIKLKGDLNKEKMRPK